MIKRANADPNKSSLRVRMASYLYSAMTMYNVAMNGATTHRIQPNAFNIQCSLVGTTLSTSYLLVAFGGWSSSSTFIVVVSITSVSPFLVVDPALSRLSELAQLAQQTHIAQPHTVQHRQQIRNGTMSVSMTPMTMPTIAALLHESSCSHDGRLEKTFPSVEMQGIVSAQLLSRFK